MRFSPVEFRLLEKCVGCAVPLLVCEQSAPGWFFCPSCRNVLDREYMENRMCCGQKLSWYGTMKACRHRNGTLGGTGKNHLPDESLTDNRRMEKLRAEASAIQTDIDSLKAQIKEKRSALKSLMEKEEEHKRKHLVKALSANGITIDDLIERLNNNSFL